MTCAHHLLNAEVVYGLPGSAGSSHEEVNRIVELHTTHFVPNTTPQLVSEPHPPRSLTAAFPYDAMSEGANGTASLNRSGMSACWMSFREADGRNVR